MKLYKKEARYVLYNKDTNERIKEQPWKDADTVTPPYINTDTTYMQLEERLVEVPHVVEVPCPVGSTLYRIDHQRESCSFHHNNRLNEYACLNEIKCPHLCDGKCDEYVKFYMTVIENADAQTILGNQKLFGKRVFTDKDQAQKVLEDYKWAEEKRLEQRRKEDIGEDED